MTVDNGNDTPNWDDDDSDDDIEFQEQSPDDMLASKIVQYFGYFEEYSLKKIAKTCVKLIISEYYKALCYGSFQFPSHDEMKAWVLEEMKQSFDEKVIPLIEQTYPDLSEEEFEEKVNLLEKMYQKEHEEQLNSTTNAALKELRFKVKALQKELAALKRKYTI